MWRFAISRLALVLPTFFGMTLLAFFLIRLVPGDPIETLAGERGIDAARHAKLLHEYGLDQPLLTQYGIYIGKVLHGLNPERALIAAEACGLGFVAIERAAAYARERIVFNRPIGMNQSVQHPLAKCWMALEAARLMTMKAAWEYDQGLDCGASANAAKYLAAEAGREACQTAVMTHGGFGYAKEFHVERFFRESLIPWIVPVSPNLILCYIAEKVLGQPKSY